MFFNNIKSQGNQIKIALVNSDQLLNSKLFYVVFTESCKL